MLLPDTKESGAATYLALAGRIRRAPPRTGTRRAPEANPMLLKNDPGDNPYSMACPNCGCAGNYRRHGSYRRRLVTLAGELDLDIERLRCLSCGATHAVIPEDVVPYKAHSESFMLATFRLWAQGSTNAQARRILALPETTRRRVVSTVRRRVCALLACMPDRRSAANAVAGCPDRRISSLHAAAFGSRVGQRASRLFKSPRLAGPRTWPFT